MDQNVDALWDKYLDNALREHEKSREPVYLGSCCKCGEKLNEGDEAYEIDGCYYCEDCMRDCKITLKEESE